MPKHEISQTRTLEQTEAAKQKESVRENLIPPQYEGLPSEVVEELWENPISIDDEKNRAEKERKENALEQIRQQESAREEQKKEFLSGSYAQLTEGQQAEFLRAQTEAAEIAIEHIQGKIKIEGLAPEEEFVLAKLQDAYREFKRKNPDKPFSFDLARDIDRKIYDNLGYRLAFNVLGLMETIDAKEEIDAIRRNLGIEAPETTKEEPTLVEEESDEEQAREPGGEELAREREYAGPLDVNNFDSIEAFAQKKELESKESYEDSLDKAIEALKDTKGIVELENTDVPTLVISDLHARRDFLVNALKQKDESGRSMFDLLKEGRVNIVCLGDGMHSEKGENWNTFLAPYYLNELAENVSDDLKEDFDDYKKALEKLSGKSYEAMDALEIRTHIRKPEIRDKWEKIEPKLQEWSMNAEMNRSLGVMKMVMELKSQFPESFHYLRGNHDDMAEAIKGYYKHADESADVKKWVKENFGEDFLDKYAEFEKSLPILVKGKDFVVSHAAPSRVFTEDQVNKRGKSTIEGLTWTDNTKRGTSQENIEQTLKNIGAENSRWIIGHRNVGDGNFRQQYDGKLIQINHEEKQLVAVLPPDGSFDPDKDTYNLA